MPIWDCCSSFYFLLLRGLLHAFFDIFFSLKKWVKLDFRVQMSCLGANKHDIQLVRIYVNSMIIIHFIINSKILCSLFRFYVKFYQPFPPVIRHSSLIFCSLLVSRSSAVWYLVISVSVLLSFSVSLFVLLYSCC